MGHTRASFGKDEDLQGPPYLQFGPLGPCVLFMPTTWRTGLSRQAGRPRALASAPEQLSAFSVRWGPGSCAGAGSCGSQEQMVIFSGKLRAVTRIKT